VSSADPQEENCMAREYLIRIEHNAENCHVMLEHKSHMPFCKYTVTQKKTSKIVFIEFLPFLIISDTKMTNSLNL